MVVFLCLSVYLSVRYSGKVCRDIKTDLAKLPTVARGMNIRAGPEIRAPDPDSKGFETWIWIRVLKKIGSGWIRIPCDWKSGSDFCYSMDLDPVFENVWIRSETLYLISDRRKSRFSDPIFLKLRSGSGF